MTERRASNDALKLRDIHKLYLEEYPQMKKQMEDYSHYREIILKLNKAAQDHILEGKTLELGHRMGKIQLVRFIRSFKTTKTGKPKLPVDWGNTRKLWAADPAAKALKKRVFFTDSQYLGIMWRRQYCAVKGRSTYGFDSSRTNGVESKVGFKNRLSDLLKSNPIMFEQIPVMNTKLRKKNDL